MQDAEESIKQSTETIELITEKGIELGMTYGPKLILALVVLVVGFWVISMLLKGVAEPSIPPK